MTFLRSLFNRSNSKASTSSQHAAVSNAADSALKKYEKTFEDLARYDRGERAGS